MYPLNATTSPGEPCSTIYVGFRVTQLRAIEDGIGLTFTLNPATSPVVSCSTIYVGFPGPRLRLIEDGLGLKYIHSILLHLQGARYIGPSLTALLPCLDREQDTVHHTMVEQ